MVSNKKIYNYLTPICKFPFGKVFIASFLKTNFDPNLPCKSVVWKKKIATLELTHSGISAFLWVTITNNRKMYAFAMLTLIALPSDFVAGYNPWCSSSFPVCATKIFGSN